MAPGRKECEVSPIWTKIIVDAVAKALKKCPHCKKKSAIRKNKRASSTSASTAVIDSKRKPNEFYRPHTPCGGCTSTSQRAGEQSLGETRRARASALPFGWNAGRF